MLFAISGNPLALVVVFAALAALIALWALRRKSRIEEKLLKKQVPDRRKYWIEKELLEKPPAQPNTEPVTEQLAVVPPALTPPALTPPALTPPALTPPALTMPAVTKPALTTPAVTKPALTTPAVMVPARTGVISPSRYQQAIFDELASGSGNVVVNAVAGSGKSTTIRQGVTKVRGRRILVSFNKNIAKENAEKLRDRSVDSRTLHSLGRECVVKSLRRGKNVDRQPHKYNELAAEFFDDMHERSVFVRLADLTRLTLTNHLDTDAVTELVAYHALDEVTEEMILRVGPVIETGNAQAKEGLIDYTDMVYLPAFMQLSPPTTYDWLFCDELQDLNASQADLVQKLLANGGRFIGVGDPKQSIYGFAGAAANSFYEVQKAFDAKEMPLSITYRCPKQVVKLAQKYVPHLQAADDAIEGVVRYIEGEGIIAAAWIGDLILCRSNAPLIRECIEMIKLGIPAHVKDKDIGGSLVAIVKKVVKSGGGHFSLEALEEFRASAIAEIEPQKRPEAAIERLNDKIMCIQACWVGWEARTDVAAFCKYIESLFSEDKKGVTLMSIHKAKGLEKGRVFVLENDKLPCYFFATTEWQREQERNLVYVAYTRPTQELVLVSKRKEEIGESARSLSVARWARRR